MALVVTKSWLLGGWNGTVHVDAVLALHHQRFEVALLFMEHPTGFREVKVSCFPEGDTRRGADKTRMRKNSKAHRAANEIASAFLTSLENA